jgi:plasmid stabilization system protein ParE
MPVILSVEALDDLERIRSFIGQENPQAANRVAVQILAACDRLEYLPERGRPGLSPGTRELTALWPYVIVYRVTPTMVEIARIWHGAQTRQP